MIVAAQNAALQKTHEERRVSVRVYLSTATSSDLPAPTVSRRLMRHRQSGPGLHLCDLSFSSPDQTSPTPKNTRATVHLFETPYRGASLVRKRTPMGPYCRPMPGVLGGSQGVGHFHMCEVPLCAPPCLGDASPLSAPTPFPPPRFHLPPAVPCLPPRDHLLLSASCFPSRRLTCCLVLSFWVNAFVLVGVSNVVKRRFEVWWARTPGPMSTEGPY